MMKKGRMQMAALALSCTMFMACLPVYAAERPDSSVKEDYIVTADNPQVLADLKADYESSLIAVGIAEGQEEGILSMSLSDDERLAVENQDGVHVEEDIMLYACGSEETEQINDRIAADQQWNLGMVSASENERKAADHNSDIKVAVIDSGVSYTTDINVEKSVNLVPGEEEILPFYEDVTGHGTSVAGVICASENGIGTTGVNPYATLYSVKVLDDNNQSPVSRVIEGIYWCINHDVDIINMSFGTSQYSSALQKAVKAADQAGILMVAAAGNVKNSSEESVQYPAAFPEVMAVGSVDAQGKRSNDSASGKEVEIMAPGEKIPSAGFLDMIIQTNGTSLSAAHVSGAASILWSMNPDKPASFIRSLLNQSARPAGRAEEYGNGILDVEYAAGHIADAAESDYNGSVDIPDNNQTPETYDDSYVDAYWASDDHENAVISYGNRNTTYPVDMIQYVRYGIKNADKSAYLKNTPNETGTAQYNGVVYRKGLHSFHGMFNYICSSVYLADIANATQKNGLTSALNNTAFPVVSSYASAPHNIYSRYQIEVALRALNCKEGWATVIPSSASLTSQRKAYAILGLSAHTAMDAFAHRSYGKENGIWVKVKDLAINPSPNGDNKTVIPHRWEVAKQVAFTILDRYYQNRFIDATVFYKKDDYKAVDFVMGSFSQYSKSSSLLNSEQTKYFSERNIDE